LVGLCQNRSASLLQDLSASHVGDFDCVVGVFNTRTSCGQVGDGVVQVRDRGFEAVLNSTEVATQIVDLLQRIVNGVEWICCAGQTCLYIIIVGVCSGF